MAYQNYIKAMKGEGNKDSPSKTNQTTEGNMSGQMTGWSGLHVEMASLQQEDYSMVHRSAAKDMQEYIILDNGLMTSLFTNKKLVENIGKTNKKLLLATNAGVMENDKKANVPGFGDVWFDDKAIANIFGFADMKKKHRITYDSDKEDAFVVHTKMDKSSSRQVLKGFISTSRLKNIKTNQKQD